MPTENVTNSTSDWENFWYDEATHDEFEFKTVWNEMEEIEPLTPITKKR
jgi:hypothetical protein